VSATSLVAALVLLAAAPTRDVSTTNLQTARGAAIEERGLVELAVPGKPLWKRFVLRYPSEAIRWNGELVVGAHGGSGGNAYSRDGRVLGTDETALDDVAGDFALANGFAYASIDRDGVGGTREGLRLTETFTDEAAEALLERLGSAPKATYLVGLSMGGGITRYAAEENPPRYQGALIVSGANGDAAAGARRRERMAEAWSRVDPRHVQTPSEEDLDAYARAAGTPVAARRFWPFMGSSTSREAPSAGPSDDTSGKLTVPTIEVVGTFDDFVLPEVLAYGDKVRAAGTGDRHRLYRVEGAWHISRDDDAISSFQYLGSRMGLDEASVDAMATGASYLRTVHESLLLLDRWVSGKKSPPPDRILKETESLLPSP
jgi:pimeloyl-ACP methyl ester carboxylesterase